MNFEESLQYLYGLQLFGIKLGLENMQTIKNRLPLLQEPLPCVHVAGTNGKGSVSVMLAEILKQAGYKVGLYTSPHLECFSERIRINGVPVSHEDIASLTQEVRDVAEDIPLTFFEATTAMALLAFKKHKVDIAIIETGLGGRLDATNIIEPQLCLITPISFDHKEHLGETLKEIAAEKAGIIKDEVPVVLGRQHKEALSTIERIAINKKAWVFLAGRDYSWTGAAAKFAVDGSGLHIEDLECRLEGSHQLDNFSQATAATVILRTRGFEVTDDAVRRAGRFVFWPGRLEWWGKGRNILADVAHNQAGVQAVTEYLEAQKISKVHLVVGLSGERDPHNVLKPLVKFVSAVYSVPVSYNQTVSPRQLCQWAEQSGLSCCAYQSATEGMSAALQNADSTIPVLVCGSLYLVAELRPVFGKGMHHNHVDC